MAEVERNINNTGKITRHRIKEDKNIALLSESIVPPIF
jgi:hypothetical protein